MRYFIVTYMQKPDGRIDEVVTVSKRLKNRDVVQANVILDFQQKKIFKCRVDHGQINADWEKLNDYYREHYPEVISQLSKLDQ